MYFAMYRLAKNHPEIKTALPAQEYLQRAYGTANAFFTVPREVWSGWSPYGTGFYNEVVIVDLIAALNDAGMKTEADTLRGFWERKVRSFVSGRQDLFRSEYAFDSTGFESTHAFARYALQHPDLPGVSRADATRFMESQIAANIFCRGWVEPAYYYLGSDYRGGAGNAYVLTYMSQMGGWGVLDYALNFSTNPRAVSAARLRLLPQRVGAGEQRHAGIQLRLLASRPGKRRRGRRRVRAVGERSDVARARRTARSRLVVLRVGD